MHAAVLPIAAFLASAPEGPHPGDAALLAAAPPVAERIATWDEALRRLQTGAPELRAARARALRAEAETRIALAALLPAVSASASLQQSLVRRSGGSVVIEGGGGSVNVGSGGTDARGTPTTPLGVLRAQAALPLVDVAAWKRLSSARALAGAEEASAAEVRRDVLQAFAQALVSLVAAERLATLNRAGLSDAIARHKITTESEALGAGTRLDMLRTRQDLDVARADVLAGDEALVQAREALGLALGRDRAVGLEPGFRLDGFVRDALAVCRPLRGPSGAAQRPDVAAAAARTEAAAAEAARARAGHLPTLGAQSTLTALTIDPGVARVNTWNLALVLTIPIFDGGARSGAARAARATLAEAEAERAAVENAAAIEIARARRAVATTERLTATAQSARDAAAEADALTAEGFRAGIGTSLELVDSAAARREAERALVLRQFELVRARLDAVIAEASCGY